MNTQTKDPQTIAPGSVIVTGRPGSNKASQVWVQSIDTQLILSSGNFFVNGTKITKDGFTDGRSRGKTMHYIIADDIITVYGPDSIKWVFPFCQLRIKP